MPEHNLSAPDKLSKARLRMARFDPFFFGLAMHMPQVESKDDFMAKLGMAVPTMAVSQRGGFIYNEDFVNSLEPDEVSYGLKHEILHLALGHCIPRVWRDKNRDLFNVACDIVIAALLEVDGCSQSSLPTLGKDCYVQVRSGTFRYKNSAGKEREIKDCCHKTAEEIYRLLMDEIPPVRSFDSIVAIYVDENGNPIPNEGEGESAGDGESGKGGKGSGQPSDEELERKWKELTIVAAKAAAAESGGKNRGLFTGNILEQIEMNGTPLAHWKDVLLEFLERSSLGDFSWARPNKKHAPKLYLPAIRPEETLAGVVVHVDTSGSVSSEELSDFFTQLKAIMSAYPRCECTLIQADHDIKSVEVLTDDTMPDVVDVHGRGGTSHTPVIEWIKEKVDEGQHIKLFLSMTDGESDIESCYPDLPSGITPLILLTEGASQKMALSLREHARIVAR